MGVSYSRAQTGAVGAALNRLKDEEVAPVADALQLYDALLRSEGNWDELLAEITAEDIRALRDVRPRNLAYVLCHAVNSLETGSAADVASRDVALATGAARLLSRMLPYLVGDASLGSGTGHERGLQQLSVFMRGGTLPQPQQYVEPDVNAVPEYRLAEAAAVSGTDERSQEAVEVDATPPPEAVESGSEAESKVEAGAAICHQAESEVEPGAALWCRICRATADALLCPELTLAPRTKAWAPPLAPGTSSAPPDAAYAPTRVEMLRLLINVCGSESLSIPSAPAALSIEAANAQVGTGGHLFLAAFAGRWHAGETTSDCCPVTTTHRSRLILSLVNGASGAPGLVDSPQGAELVLSCMRALLLLVCVADYDLPWSSTPDDAPALFAGLGPPQAAALHASIASVLATAASQTTGAAEWADVISETVAGDTTLSRVVRRIVPSGAGEALALGLAAAERMPEFMTAATGFLSQGGWMLAGPVLALMASLREEQNAAALLRGGSLLLLLLSTTRQFAVCLNEPLRASDLTVCVSTGLGSTVPPYATRGDALLAALALMLAYPLSGGASIHPQARPLYTPLLAVFRNVAPYLKGLTPVGAGSAMHIIASLAQPSVLLADESGAQLLSTALDCIAAVVERQGESNAAMIAALLRHRSLLHDLATMTPFPPDSDACVEEPAVSTQASAVDDAASNTPGSSLLEGLTLAASADTRPFQPDDAWLNSVRSSWPLGRLLSMLDAIAPVHAAWRAAHPAADVYAEAAFLATQTLVGGTYPLGDIPRPSTYAKTSAVSAWQARNALSLVLLADPHAFDGPRVRRLKVTRQVATRPAEPT